MSNKTQTFWVIIIICIVIIAGIFSAHSLLMKQSNTKESNIDLGLILDEPCKIPCWEGITPGLTTSEEAYEIIKNNSHVKQNTLEIGFDMETGGITWWWDVPGKWIQPGIEWKAHIVKEITLGITFDFSVGESIERYGPPEAVSIVQGGTPESWFWIFIMYYPSKGFELVAILPYGENTLNSSTDVEAFILYSPQTLEARITEPNHTVYDYQMWKGYGDVIELYGAIMD